MAMEKITENGVAIALVTGTCALTDEQTALDLIMEARYTLGAERIDYSGYTSKPLRDFIRESNRGRDVFFPATRQEAILRLAGV